MMRCVAVGYQTEMAAKATEKDQKDTKTKEDDTK
jgi:hypothetical protein